MEARHQCVRDDRHRDRGEDEGPQNDRDFVSRLLNPRLRTVSVGKTASQIISVSWCLDGGGAGVGRGVVRSVDMFVLLEVFGVGWRSWSASRAVPSTQTGDQEVRAPEREAATAS